MLLMWLLTCLDGERLLRNADGDMDAADDDDDDPAES